MRGVRACLRVLWRAHFKQQHLTNTFTTNNKSVCMCMRVYVRASEFELSNTLHRTYKHDPVLRDLSSHLAHEHALKLLLRPLLTIADDVHEKRVLTSRFRGTYDH